MQQSEILDVSIRKSVAKEELKDLLNEIEAAQEKLNLTDIFSNKVIGKVN
ncbi:MAG TPA: hypothetical protein VKA95_01530 [Nitrososphaeraceae archaeon]|nr:hypothetical protein [Nitrososphaeraceae archaeon]